MNLSTKDLVYAALFVALTAAMASISIPLPGGIPLTLQPFAVNFAGFILGPKLGALSMVVYVILGALGVPVFAGGAGGFNTVLGPTGGFIWSFPLMAYVSGIWAKSKIGMAFFGVALGTMIGFAAGVFQLMLYLNSTLVVAIANGFLPFIIPTFVRIVSVPVIGKLINTSLEKNGIKLA